MSLNNFFNLKASGLSRVGIIRCRELMFVSNCVQGLPTRIQASSIGKDDVNLYGKVFIMTLGSYSSPTFILLDGTCSM